MTSSVFKHKDIFLSYKMEIGNVYCTQAIAVNLIVTSKTGIL